MDEYLKFSLNFHDFFNYFRGHSTAVHVIMYANEGQIIWDRHSY